MSTWSTSEALTDPAIREPIAFKSEFRFSLRNIPPEITLRLSSPIHSDRILVRQSHSISVPGLDPQEQAGCDAQVQEGEALQTVISHFVCVYNAAVAQGFEPAANWLQPNSDFR